MQKVSAFARLWFCACGLLELAPNALSHYMGSFAMLTTPQEIENASGNGFYRSELEISDFQTF